MADPCGPAFVLCSVFAVARVETLENGQHACDQRVTDNVLVAQLDAGNVINIAKAIRHFGQARHFRQKVGLVRVAGQDHS